jgi:signal peptidase I
VHLRRPGSAPESGFSLIWLTAAVLHTPCTDVTETPVEPHENPHRPDRRAGRRLVVGLLVLLLLRLLLVQQFYISGPSMQGTLTPDDRVMVEKVTGTLRDVRRGDVIVFRHNTDEGPRDLIKRVIGLPGDTVRVDACRVYLGSTPLDEPYLDEFAEDVFGDGCGGGTDGPVAVPPGHLFVMGDNRPQSSDSRAFGTVPISSVIGRAVVVLWPPSSWRSL